MCFIFSLLTHFVNHYQNCIEQCIWKKFVCYQSHGFFTLKLLPKRLRKAHSFFKVLISVSHVKVSILDFITKNYNCSQETLKLSRTIAMMKTRSLI